MKHETAGDPVTGLKWTRKTTGKIAEKLKALDLNISANTVGRILKEMGFSLRVKHNLNVTVCHYPPGSSKWNPIEHRLFSEISKNGAGVPLESYEKVIKYARTTTTATGLKVRARLIRKEYQKGQQVSDEDMNNLSIEKHDLFPNWNYTLKLD